MDGDALTRFGAPVRGGLVTTANLWYVQLGWQWHRTPKYLYYCIKDFYLS